jgi:NAD(P)-dependent dehydrogenase (short-subunit alcohol dehydrogenase family)
MQELRGKVAVVTGSASGLGFGIASRLVDEGARVMLADLDEPALARAAERLGERGSVFAVRTDVARPESIERLREATESHFGPAQLVFNNAGVCNKMAPAADVPLPVWEWVVSVNLWGVVHGVRTFLPGMIERGEGHLVNTSSGGGLSPRGFIAPYTATKYAVVGLTSALYYELQEVGSPVRVSALCPGLIRSNIERSLRGWPAELGAIPEVERAGGDPALRGRVRPLRDPADGMDPLEAGVYVVDAVRADRFWIFPNVASPEADFGKRRPSLSR